MKNSVSSMAWLISALLLGSCGSSRIGNGKLQVELADAPAAFQAVNVTVTSVEVHYLGESDGSGSARWLAVASNPGTFNLLSLQNGVTAVLGVSAIPEGKYDRIRLGLGAAEVVTGGTTTPMTIPAGAETGLSVDYAFTVAEKKGYTVVLDFDAAKSVRMDSNGAYMMMPVLSVMHFNHMQAANGETGMGSTMGGTSMGNSATTSTMPKGMMQP